VLLFITALVASRQRCIPDAVCLSQLLFISGQMLFDCCHLEVHIPSVSPHASFTVIGVKALRQSSREGCSCPPGHHQWYQTLDTVELTAASPSTEQPNWCCWAGLAPLAKSGWSVGSACCRLSGGRLLSGRASGAAGSVRIGPVQAAAAGTGSSQVLLRLLCALDVQFDCDGIGDKLLSLAAAR